MQNFTTTQLNKLFDVEGVVTIHYFEFGKNYFFTGEKHNFWEIVYIDKGDADILIEDKWDEIRYGNAFFHSPMQYHNLKANGVVAPNASIITFVCNSPAMSKFHNLKIKLNTNEKNIIGRIISLASKAFSSPLDDPFTSSLIKNGNDAAEQLIQVYIEELLLLIYTRICDHDSTKQKIEINERTTTTRIIEFMTNNIHRSLTIKDISCELLKSESDLKRSFSRDTGVGIMTYFRNMKINHAKQLLRQGEMNITEISENLGYGNIHHFSKQFKDITGMSPKEYTKSIRLRLDDDIRLKKIDHI